VLSSLILSFASPKFLFLLLLIPLSIAKGYIKQKYSGLTFNEKYATIRKTNGLRVTTMITLKKYVETTNTAQSLFMKKKNLHHYELAVYSEKLTETYKAKFLNSPDKAIFHKYLEL